MKLLWGFLLAASPLWAGPLKITFVGDIMLDELPGNVIKRGQDPFAHVASSLKADRLRIGNLECVVATTGTAVIKPVVFQAHPRVLPSVAKYFDAVSIANNHSGEYGKGAFVEMLGYL